MLQEALGSSVALAHESVQSLGHGFHTARWVEVTSETCFFTYLPMEQICLSCTSCQDLGGGNGLTLVYPKSHGPKIF